ncbi:protein anon-73B1 isoform X1 [Stomoxys calcitrans]|uniref:protein anon-73B1 isoform X1 n=1 Tax=Stomoxys calcitrans TaxID=35570 RepID=UPI0027E2CD59|nr:protein anon-73B1 isoform X1 [Stomoxys calcitrans]
MDANILDKYGDEDIFGAVLKWGLYFGAFFQLACIVVSIVWPYTSHQDNTVDSLDVKMIQSLMESIRNQTIAGSIKSESKKRKKDVDFTKIRIYL